MAKKIKIIVESPEQNVVIPAIPLSAAAAILKVVLWGSQYVPASSRDPFRLVEVESGPNRVLIDILG